MKKKRKPLTPGDIWISSTKEEGGYPVWWLFKTLWKFSGYVQTIEPEVMWEERTNAYLTKPHIKDILLNTPKI